MTKLKYKDFDEGLMEQLQDDQFALDYITCAITDGYGDLALEALKEVRRATKPEKTQEVEEGKAHVMRWVDVGEFSELRDSPILTCKKRGGLMLDTWFDEVFHTHRATFNNNNGEIPMPKEGE